MAYFKDPSTSTQWIKERQNETSIIAERYLIIEKIGETDLARYRCLSPNEAEQSPIEFRINKLDLNARRFPKELQTNLYIEFQSSINQFKSGGSLAFKCSSSDKTPVHWIVDRFTGNVHVNQSYLFIKKFNASHFGYYRCSNDKIHKLLLISPQLFNVIKNINSDKSNQIKYNRSFIEILQGNYIGDNVTLICRVGQGRAFSRKCVFF